jgi:hypothetical protein
MLDPTGNSISSLWDWDSLGHSNNHRYGNPCGAIIYRASNQKGELMARTILLPTVDPVIEAYKKDIDRTLLRENLRLSVQQRFENLMQLQRFAKELQRARQLGKKKL